MIAAIRNQESRTETPANHAAFVAMLPAIRRTAQITFRKVRPELRDELIEEVVANCYVAYARLIERGQADRALPSPLARFAIAQVRAGRRVGNRLRISDALSSYAQYRKQFFVEPTRPVRRGRRLLAAGPHRRQASDAGRRRCLPDRLRRMAAAIDGPAPEDRLGPGQRRDDERRRGEIRSVAGADLPASRMAKEELGGVSRRGRDRRTTATGGRLRRDMVQPATDFGRGGLRSATVNLRRSGGPPRPTETAFVASVVSTDAPKSPGQCALGREHRSRFRRR